MAGVWSSVGEVFQPVAVAVVTVSVFALLRLITPTVRWSRRLKHDSEIHSALPEGDEKALWAASVTAQGERLRLYRENSRFWDQALAWYALVLLAFCIVYTIAQAARGWPLFGVIAADFAIYLPLTGAFLINLAFALVIAVRLVLGLSTTGRTDGVGHYPQYVAYMSAVRRRSARRVKIERRASAVQALRDLERRTQKAVRHADPEA